MLLSFAENDVLLKLFRLAVSARFDWLTELALKAEERAAEIDALRAIIDEQVAEIKGHNVAAQSRQTQIEALTAEVKRLRAMVG